MRTIVLLVCALTGAGALGCTRTTVQTRSWGDPSSGYATRRGKVVTVTETLTRTEGDTEASALAGAAVGAAYGSGLAHSHRGGWGHHHGHRPHGLSATGAVAGALAGAVVGAALGAGRDEQRAYQILVEFEDGGTGSFLSGPVLLFEVGDTVCATGSVLARC